ncbi:MAG: bifunctional DNA primase/polymerase, partial [Nitrososphaerota archaeon]
MSLAEAARKYYDAGLNVVPVKIYRDAGGKWIKKPIMDYSDLHHRRQTREEFQCIDWSAADGIALICGRETEKGFFCAIDIDLPYDEALYKLKTFLKFKITRMEKTVSNRLHLLYFSERPVPSLKLENCPLELLGRGRIVVVYPSKGYEALNDNHPSILEDAFTFFLELAKHFGFDVEDRLIGRAGAREDEAKLAEWLEIILGSGKLEVLGRGPNYYYIRCPFHPPDRHPSFALNHRKFYAIDYHDASIYSLK